MADMNDWSNLYGEKNVFRRYNRSHTRAKVWAIIIISLILVIACYFFAKSILTYTLTFDTLGGTEIASVELKYLEEMPRPASTSTKYGYYLDGWSKDKEGTKSFMFGSKIWRDTTAYARWKEGVAISLNFAEGEENSDLSTETLKTTYEKWLKPGSSDELPVVVNQNEASVHYGERLLWFETPECTGDPIFGKTYSLSQTIEVYGKWFDIDEGKFEVLNNGTLQKYNGYCANIILPSNVKSIRNISRVLFNTSTTDQLQQDKANFSVFENVMGKLKSVYLNDGIQRIGSCAFKDCEVLEKVHCLGDSLLSIGDYAFENTAITTFTLSSGMDSIGSNAFNGAKKLKSIEIGSNITTIEEGAFANSGLVSIVLPSVTNIGPKAFAGCQYLVEVTFMHTEMVNANSVTVPEVVLESDNVFMGTFINNTTYNKLRIYVPDYLLDDYKQSYPWYVYADCLVGRHFGA